MKGVWRVLPSRKIPECQSKSGLLSRNTPASPSIGSVRQARPRLNGPRPIAMKSRSARSAGCARSWSDSGSRGVDKSVSQVLVGVLGEQVEDGGDVGGRGPGVEQGEFQVVAAAHLGARDDRLAGGEQ